MSLTQEITFVKLVGNGMLIEKRTSQVE